MRENYKSVRLFVVKIAFRCRKEYMPVFSVRILKETEEVDLKAQGTENMV